MKTELLYDIKPLEVVPDHSFELFSLLVLCFICSLVVIFFALRYHFRQKDQKSLLPQWKNHLLSLDLDDTKKSAYILTKWGLKGVENDDQKRAYHELLTALSPYKYKKNVDPFDDTTRSMIITFIHEVTHV